MQHELGFDDATATTEHGHGGSRSDDLDGEVRFMSAEEQAQRTTELLGSGALVVTVAPPARHARGHLGELLEELVERELARAGAPSPYLAAWTAMPEDAHARLADQLFRARTTGATGLALAVGSLAAIASPVLTPDDSATLRWLADATEMAPLVLILDDADLALAAFSAPVSLSDLLTPSVELRGFEATTNDTRVASVDLADAIASMPSTPAPCLPPEAPSVPEIEVTISIPGERAHEQERAHEPERGKDHPRELELEHEQEPDPERETIPRAAPPPRLVLAEQTPDAPPARRARAARRVTAGIPVSGPNDAWRTWAIALSAAKGAQPLAAFERLFAESYVPLANAIASGVDDPRALRAYDEFRRSFERSYTDAFATFGATNRRPRLVMDVFDIGAKQARLSNARSAHVLIVDSMRYDLGALVKNALTAEVAGAATFAGELILWSALPTTTMRQLETFARGIDALRAPAHEEASESLRGRASEAVRRMRVGSREVHKLDIVPAMLESASHERDVIACLPAIAGATAEAIARHVTTLPPRTLVLVVGDHGFSVGRHGEIQTGGASPEEVLVPAHAWFLGELH